MALAVQMIGRGARPRPVVKRLLPALLAVITALTMVLAAQAGTWTPPQSITAPGISPVAPSIAYDPAGYLHVAYIIQAGITRGLYYATNRTGVWQSTRIAAVSTIGEEWTSLAVDGNGKAHVAYQWLNHGIYYLTNRSGSWTRRRIRPSSSFVVYPEIALDGVGKVHLAYFVPSPTAPGIRYTTNASGTWITTRITRSAFDIRVDLAVDAARKAHLIIGRTGNGYRYITNRTGSWRSQTIFGGLRIVRAPSIALDSNGAPIVAYSDAELQVPGGYGTWYAVRTASGWSAAQLDPATGWATQIRVAPDHAIHVVAMGATHWTNETGSWQAETAAFDVQTPLKAAFAIGAAGQLAIAYPRTDGSLGLTTSP